MSTKTEALSNKQIELRKRLKYVEAINLTLMKEANDSDRLCQKKDREIEKLKESLKEAQEKNVAPQRQLKVVKPASFALKEEQEKNVAPQRQLKVVKPASWRRLFED